MALDDLQFHYRGLTFGAGTDIHVNRAEGFEGFDSRSSDSELPNGDGSIRGLDYVGPRTVAFELAIVGVLGAETTYEQHWAQIRDAFRPSRSDDFPLTFKRPGMPERVIYCRPIQLTRKEEYGRFNTVGFPPVVLRAVDPRIYAAEERSVTVPVYGTITGGFELAGDLPFDLSSIGRQMEAVAVNNGTAPAFPLVRFYTPAPEVGTVYYPDEDIYPSEDLFPVEPLSPGGTTGAGAGVIDGVRLTNTTTGEVLDIQSPIVDQQILVADMKAAVTGASRLVISIDDASRYGSWTLPREAFSLAPGDNTLRFEVTGTSTTARCHVSWSDTWID